MKAPVRWKDAEADPALRELFRAAPRTEPLPAANRLRGARHAAALALVPFVSASLWSKGVAAAFGLCFGGALALVSVSPALRSWLGESAPAVPSAVASAAPHGLVAPASPSAVPAEAAAPSAPTASASAAAAPLRPIGEQRSRPRSLTPRVAAEPLSGFAAPSAAPELPPAPPRAGMSAELELLLVARHRLSSDPAAALLLLDRHRDTFPAGALATEREVLAVDALLRCGRRAEAERRGSALLGRGENAFYADRLKQLLHSSR